MFHFEVFEFVKRGRGRPKANNAPADRELQIKKLHEDGLTMKAIGDEFGISRERVRQILKKDFGVVALDGGFHNKVLLKNIGKQKDLKSRQQSSIETTMGCSKEVFDKINGGKRRWVKNTPSCAYLVQKQNAGKRGIEWGFTFPEWWNVWQESGKWEMRGRGEGYCMTRVGDTGAYEVGNVEIKTIGENFSESFYKHSPEDRREKAKSNGNNYNVGLRKTHCKRGHELTDDSVYHSNGNRTCRACCKERYEERKLEKRIGH